MDDVAHVLYLGEYPVGVIPEECVELARPHLGGSWSIEDLPVLTGLRVTALSTVISFETVVLWDGTILAHEAHEFRRCAVEGVPAEHLARTNDDPECSVSVEVVSRPSPRGGVIGVRVYAYGFNSDLVRRRYGEEIHEVRHDPIAVVIKHWRPPTALYDGHVQDSDRPENAGLRPHLVAAGLVPS